ncbi:MAG: hypothetical protein OXI74_16425, partial [Rhodospirillaceae bacterium]|nr:hypothetical protein [Rhodospirillaceae bacterium]
MRRELKLQQLAARNPLRGRSSLQLAPNRRQFVAGLAASAGAALFGCGPAREQGGELALLTWDAYADPRLLDLWRDRTGGSIRYEIHISDPTSV